jgi:acyl dehydratase
MDKYFEEYVIGEKTESHSRTITEADIVNFAGVSGDFHPASMSKTFAQERLGLDRMLAHGCLVLSAAMGLAWVMKLNSKNLTYGYDRVRFIKPVLAGDTVHVVGTVVDISDHPKKPTHGKVVMRLEVLKDNDELAMVLDHIMLIERRNKEENSAATIEAGRGEGSMIGRDEVVGGNPR